MPTESSNIKSLDFLLFLKCRILHDDLSSRDDPPATFDVHTALSNSSSHISPDVDHALNKHNEIVSCRSLEERVRSKRRHDMLIPFR
jgi:hypothetical protein